MISLFYLDLKELSSVKSKYQSKPIAWHSWKRKLTYEQDYSQSTAQILILFQVSSLLPATDGHNSSETPVSPFLFAYINNIYDSRKAVFSGLNLEDFRAASILAKKGTFLENFHCHLFNPFSESFTSK